MTNRLKLIFLAVAACVTPAFIGSFAWADSPTEIARNLETFSDIYKELNSYYVDSINAEKAITTAINAMLDEVDPYTEYFPPKEQEDFKTVSTGEYGGVGSYIMERNGNVYFSEPYHGSPAAKMGVRAGDKIIMIDTASTKGWNNEQVSAALKGLPNTNVRIVVERPYATDSIITFNIKREKIEMNPVTYYGVEKGNIGYIAINTFNEKTSREVKKALLELMDDKRVEGITLDLRGNGGGLLDQAVQVVGFFVPKGTTVVETKGKVKEQNRVYKTSQDPIAPKIPLTVLIDGGTASASEIVSGALQDLDRAVVIGWRSFGKGLVQTTRPLPFDAMLKVTVAKYYIPSGRLIQAIDYSKRNEDGSVERIPDSLTHVFNTAHGRKVRDGGGITPDIEVKYTPMNRLTYNILRDHWDFDFATKFFSEHKSIGSAESFVITDSIYNEFKNFINPKKFAYDKTCETQLKYLRDAAEAEGYMTDSVKAEFAVLERLLHHDLSRDLDYHRKAIAPLIANEIQKRYHYQRGAAIEALKDDEAMDKASELFSDLKKYTATLSSK